MKIRLVAAATIIALSTTPLVAAEQGMIKISKDKLTPTAAISQLVPVMDYKSAQDVADSEIYTNQIGDLIPTMTAPKQ